MNLETLYKRKRELDQACVNTANSHQIIIGHKAECDFWISELEKSNPVIATPEEVPVE